MSQRLRDLVTGFDWGDPPPIVDILDFLEVPRDADPRDESIDQPGAYAFFLEQAVEWEQEASDIKDEIAKISRKFAVERDILNDEVDDSLTAAFSEAMEKAAERLTNESIDKGLRAPTVDRIKGAATADPLYRQAFQAAKQARLAESPFEEEIEELRSQYRHAKVMAGKFDAIAKALSQRATILRVAGDLIGARLRSRLSDD